jgi:hypothetical protein
MWLLAACVGGLTFLGGTDSVAQVRRYEPARPTISPYINLFRRDRGVLPNYHTYVRPIQQQYQLNEYQQQVIQQQNRAINQLQSNVQGLQQNQAAQLVAPTGKGSWFNRPSSRNAFMNTSRYYSQSGGGTPQR